MKIKHILVALTMVLLSQTGLKAQEEIVYNQYYYNYYLVNPAVAGAERCTHFMWTGFMGWTGMEGKDNKGETPRFTTLSFRTRLRGGLERLGIGAYAYVDKNGNSLRRGGQVSLGYHIPLSGSSTRGYMMKQRDITRQLSFALACVVNGYGYESELFQQQSTDIVIDNGGENKGYYFNATFGTYFLFDNFFAGLTIANLVPTKLEQLGKTEPIRPINPFIFLGYDFQLGDGMQFEPGAMFKFNIDRNDDEAVGESTQTTEKVEKGSERQLDIHLKFMQDVPGKDFGYWVELLYRHSLDSGKNIDGSDVKPAPLCLRPMGGIRIKKFNIGYTYGLGLTGVNKFNKGDHELMLSYSFCKTQHFCR
jgi:type IX secretion system PorP/SprF family membrane protein